MENAMNQSFVDIIEVVITMILNHFLNNSLTLRCSNLEDPLPQLYTVNLQCKFNMFKLQYTV